MILAAFAPLAFGVVVDAQPGGFQVREVAEVSASTAAVWKAMVEPSKWWDPEHTWSGDARNLRLRAKAGGCFCERIPPGGSVRHLTVVYVEPGKELRMEGALGPLSMLALAGSFVVELSTSGDATRLVWTYTVGGYGPGGIDGLAAAVDLVLGQQVARLKQLVETGKPAS